MGENVVGSICSSFRELMARTVLGVGLLVSATYDVILRALIVYVRIFLYKQELLFEINCLWLPVQIKC